MKKGLRILFCVSLVLVLSVSIVSANVFDTIGDFWKRVTGQATDSLSASDVSSDSKSDSKESSSSVSSSPSASTSSSPSSSSVSSSSSKKSSTPTTTEGNETNNSCTDSDGGINYLVYGYVEGIMDNNPFYYEDICLDVYYLQERFCSGDSPQSRMKSCSDLGGGDYYCFDGRCVINGTNETNETIGSVVDITGYTDPDFGIISFGAQTEGNIDYVRFLINFNGGAWQDIGTDFSYPYFVDWSDEEPREDVRIQAWPYYNGLQGPDGRVEGPFQYLGRNDTNQTYYCLDSDGGREYFIKGNVSGINESGSYAFEDFCSRNYLFEHSCVGEHYERHWINCMDNYEATCNNGACVASRGIFSTITNFFSGLFRE